MEAGYTRVDCPLFLHRHYCQMIRTGLRCCQVPQGSANSLWFWQPHLPAIGVDPFQTQMPFISHVPCKIAEMYGMETSCTEANISRKLDHMVWKRGQGQPNQLLAAGQRFPGN
eukprot:1147374-Pelagomonas_calceolata.AAC.11